MKNKTLTFLLLLSLLSAGSFQASGQDKKAKKIKTGTLKCWVSMDCLECQTKIEKNIPFEKGVTDLKVDYPTKIVTVTFKPEKTTAAKVEKAIQKLGFTTEIVPEKK